MSRWSVLLLGAAVAVLLLVDVLAFHDLLEPHPARDWLVLAASVLALGCLAAELASRLRRTSHQR